MINPFASYVVSTASVGIPPKTLVIGPGIIVTEFPDRIELKLDPHYKPPKKDKDKD